MGGREIGWEIWLDRLYGVLLHAYPGAFRRGYGEAMREAFRDRCRAAHSRSGRRGLVRVTGLAVVDAIRNGALERWSAAAGGRSGGGRWRSRIGIAGTLREASRRLMRTPTFALAMTSSVALGVAAFASVASVADGVLLDPLPYASPDRLLWVWRDYSWADLPRGWLGGPDIALLREHEDVFEDVVGFRSGRANLAGEAGGTAEEAMILLASGGFFDVLGVTPMLGRGFRAGESEPGAEPVAVLSHELWQRRWGGDPDVVGRRIVVDGESWTVVGVMSPGFRFVKHSSLGDPEPADIYGTLRMDLGTLNVGFGGFAGLARVRADAAAAAVEAALAETARELDASFRNQGLRLWAIDLKSDLTGDISPALIALVSAASFLLLILTANLATLQYGRAEERSRDVAVRAALGGGRLAAVSGFIVESMMVTAAGCVAGLWLATLAVRGLLSLAPANLPRREAIDLDGSVITATIAVTLVMGVLAAIGPALRVSGRATAQVLRASDPRAGGGVAARTRSALVVVQVAMSLILLVGAGLVGRSALLLLATEPGFEPAGVLTFRVPLDDATYPDSASVVRLHGEYLARLASMPGVAAAGATSALPLGAGTDQGPVAFPDAEGNTGDADVDSPLIDELVVTPDYLEAMGIRLRSGRRFEASDTREAPLVALIDRTLAERFFPRSEPVGRTLHYLGDTMTVAGVVEHTRLYDMHSDGRGQVYLPAAQHPEQSMYYAVRTGRDPVSLVSEARASLREMDASLPLTEVRPASDLVNESLGRHRLTVVLLAAFAGGALLLAAMGIWGVVAGGVIRRTPEIGIRLALGATAARVLRLVAAEAARVIVIGLAIGLLGALAASRLLETLLFGVRAWDPLTYAGVATFLFIVAGVACLAPALRAVRIQPTQALRGE